MAQSDFSPRSGFAALIVRLSGAWVLAGALAKLFKGTPKDLPQIVRDLTPFPIDLTFHLVIAVELAIVSLAWIKPRLAWPVILALFLFFDSILIPMVAQGAESCGCFGASIKVSPRVMLAVDSALLLSLLASRPWSSIRGRGLHTGLLAAALAISFAAPWLVIPGPAPAGPKGALSPDTPPPRWVTMEPEKWVNQSIYDIRELTQWVRVEQMPTDGKVILWRQSCDHCAAHLRKLAAEDDPTKPLLLIQIRDDLDASSLVDLMPQGDHVTRVALPENQQVFLETPWELEVAGGVVTSAAGRTSLETKSGG